MATKKARENAITATREIYARDHIAAGDRKKWLLKLTTPVTLNKTTSKTFPFKVKAGDFDIEAFDSEAKMRTFVHSLHLTVESETIVIEADT